MKKKMWLTAGLFALLALVLSAGVASAHTTVHVGNYDVEVGWVDEPPIVGQRNAIVVNVSDTTATDKQVDVSALVVNVDYGGQNKTLTLQPLSEDATNQYIAPILPMVAGQYTVQLRGKIADTDVNTDVQPEEVVAADTLAFPSSAGGAGSQGQRNGFGGGGFGGGGFGFRMSDWFGVAGLVAGLAGLIVAILAFRKAH